MPCSLPCYSGRMRPLDLLTAVFVALVWGLNFVVIKLGLAELPPLLFSALRFTVAALPWIFLVGRPQAPWRIILGIGLFLGLLKFSALFIEIWACRRGSPR